MGPRRISRQQKFAPERVVVRDPPGHLAAAEPAEDVRDEVEGAGPLPVGQALQQGYPDEGKDKAGMSVHEIKEFLTVNQVTASEFLMVYPGTVQEILKAQRVQTAFQQVLASPDAAEALQHPALKPLLEEAAD
jgi:hypothetical protein